MEGFTRTHRRIDADIRAVEILPGPWFEVLLRLSRSAGHELPLTRLAKEISFSSGGFTKMTDRLVAAGLIERHPDISDRRVTLARLTSRGAEVLEEALEHHVDSLRRHVLAPLGAERFAELAAAMESLRDANDPPPKK